MKCAGNHRTPECPPSDNLKIKCSNCLKDHTENYGSCRFNPRNIKNNRLSTIRNGQATFSSKTSIPNLSYSNIAKNEPHQEIPPPPLILKISLHYLLRPAIPSIENLDEILKKLEKNYDILNKIINLPNNALLSMFAQDLTGIKPANSTTATP